MNPFNFHGNLANKLRWFALGLLIAIITASAYLCGLPGYWAFDDYGSILHNTTLQFRSFDWPHIAAILFSSIGLLHRPLSMLTFYLDALLFGIEPYPFKLTNIFIHLLAGFSLGLMARQLLNLAARREPRLTPTAINGLSFTATALWLVHPLNLTAVLYVVQRETALSAIFTALAVWTYLLGRQYQLDGNRTAWPFIWLFTPLLTFIGLLCKENAALVPAFLFVIELTVLKFWTQTRRQNIQIMTWFAVFLVIPALAIISLLVSGSPTLLGGYLIRNFTMGERLLTECRVVFDYLTWIFLPNIGQLGLYHDDFIVSRGIFNPPTTLLALTGLILLIAFAWFARKRMPWISFAILWFLGGQLMESTVLPLELMFEHRNYLPIYGVILGVTITAYFLLTTIRRQRVGIIIAILATIVLALLTALRASSWNSPLKFAIAQVIHHPLSARARYELGVMYVAMTISGNPNMATQAEAAMLASRALTPDSISQDTALVIMYTDLGQSKKAVAYLNDAAQRVRTGIFNAQTQTALASIARYTDKHNTIPFNAGDHLFQNTLENPFTKKSACFTADIWNSYGIFLKNQGHFPQSIKATEQALTLCPSNIGIHINYTIDLLQIKNIEAVKQQISIIEKANFLGKYSLILNDLRHDLKNLQSPLPILIKNSNLKS